MKKIQFLILDVLKSRMILPTPKINCSISLLWLMGISGQTHSQAWHQAANRWRLNRMFLSTKDLMWQMKAYTNKNS